CEAHSRTPPDANVSQCHFRRAGAARRLGAGRGLYRLLRAGLRLGHGLEPFGRPLPISVLLNSRGSFFFATVFGPREIDYAPILPAKVPTRMNETLPDQVAGSA